MNLLFELNVLISRLSSLWRMFRDQFRVLARSCIWASRSNALGNNSTYVIRIFLFNHVRLLTNLTCNCVIPQMNVHIRRWAGSFAKEGTSSETCYSWRVGLQILWCIENDFADIIAKYWKQANFNSLVWRKSYRSNCCSVHQAFVWNAEDRNWRHVCVRHHALMCSRLSLALVNHYSPRHVVSVNPVSQERPRQRRTLSKIWRQFRTLSLVKTQKFGFIVTLPHY